MIECVKLGKKILELNDKIMEIIGELRSVKNDPPTDDCGWYGLVFSRWNKSDVKEGWLNNGRWFIDNNEVYPIYWCSIKSYYKTKITFIDSYPFNCKVEDPQGSYKIYK